MFLPKFTRLEGTMEHQAGRRGVVPLTVAVGILVAATALFAVLYVMKRSDIGRLAEQVGTTESSIADRTARVAAITSTVDDMKAEYSRLTTTNTELRACANAARDSIAAAQRSDRTGFDSAMAKAFINCRR
ncbi:hypothetical protein [Kibdelosporangium aridum]|uniref:hypothetical protein n=1 Tax=Kibdelosporangium aridum TaxID=2030 RepID=UPI0009FE376F|nr:hypothetical protein [Kibdelosporangium aridum]